MRLKPLANDTNPSNMAPRRPALWGNLGLTMLLVCLSPALARAQDDDVTTPLGLRPGSPAGSYALSEFDTVSLFSGTVNFRLPLLKIGGRGEAGTDVLLAIDCVWGLRLSEHSGQAIPRFNRWRGLRPGYGPGTMRTYKDTNPTTLQVTRLMTFTGPDGTQYEFRDDRTEGEPKPGGTPGFNRGWVFRTFDGSGLTFLSDQDVYDATGPFQASGNLMFPNGTRYRIDTGLVSYIVDRNGNKVSFTYEATPHDPQEGPQVVQIRDSLHRVVDFEYASAGTSHDTIRYTGFGDTPRTILVHHTTLDNALFAGETVKTYSQLFPTGILWGTPDNLFNPTVVSSLDLPNGRSYAFTYDSYGEVAELTLPTGGYHQYTYGRGNADTGPSGEYHWYAIYRRLLEKRVYDENDQLQLQIVFGMEEARGARDQYVVVNHNTTAGGGFSEVHDFYGRASDALGGAQEPAYPQWKDGREYKTETVSGTGALVRTVEQEWVQLAAVPWRTDLADTPAYEPRLGTTRTRLEDVVPPQTPPLLVTQYGYAREEDPINVLHRRFTNTTDVSEFDFGGTVLKRRRHTDYLEAPAYTTPSVHIRRSPLGEYVYNGDGVLQARTTYEYDNYSTPLVSRPTLSGRLDPDPFGTSYTTRGNVTAVRRWLNTTNQDLVEQRQYDMAGNVVKIIDPRLHSTGYTYSDRFGPPDGVAEDNPHPLPDGTRSYAFVSAVLNAKSQLTYTQRDYATGQPVDIQDANRVVTTVFYSDSLDRPTEVIRANNTTSHSRTKFSYNDVDRIVTTLTDKNDFANDITATKRQSRYDGLGREIDTRLFEGEVEECTDLLQCIRTERAFDGVGRTVAVSNPYRHPLRVGENPPDWRTTEYDALGREILVTLPGGGPVTTQYSGVTTTVTDPALRVRQSVADALGRVVTVTEDPSGLNYRTSYGYDLLDNLTAVTQGGQARTVGYDSLSRLTFSTTPEAGTVSYTDYDGNGNLKRKQDARNVVAQYDYDELDRTLTRTYSDGTPTVSFTYDSGSPAVPYAAGRLVSVTAGSTTVRQDEYDPLGRVLRSTQATDGVPFSQSYNYDLAGRLRSETYPSRRVVATTYDHAGRISGVQGARASLGSISYTPAGAVTSAQLGNGLWESVLFNMRLQPKWVRLGQSPTTSEIFELQNGYGDPLTNNGNIYFQLLTAGGVPFSVGYGYDGANRLKTATEDWSTARWTQMAARADTCLARSTCGLSNPEDPSATTWTQTYDYDRWGNRAVTAGTVLDPVLTPTSLSLFNTSTNRLTNSGYDNAGNQTIDAASRVFTYDAENLQTSAIGSTSYVYDGLGRRVKKVQGTTTTTFVYDTFGKLVAEYCEPANKCGAMSGVRYVTTDHLANTRVVTDDAAQVLSRHDYLPFGEEVPLSFGGRSAIPGYGSNPGVRQKFTGKERDLETGLDYFLARYLSGAQGRFTSADDALVGADPVDPQSWHLFAYTGNSPLTRVDPDGHEWFTKEGEWPTWINCGYYPLACQSQAAAGWDQWSPTEPDDILKWASGNVTFYLRADGRTAGWDAPVKDISWETAGQVYTTVGFARLGVGLARQGIAAVAGRQAAAEVRVFGAQTVGAAQVRTLQSGGNTITSNTANALNRANAMSLSRREWGRALEALKGENGLPPSHHGKITITGDYFDEAGHFIDNLLSYIP